jgi:hypothetical protein
LFRLLFRDGWTLFREVAFAYDHPRHVPGPDGAPRTQYVFRRETVDRYNQRFDEVKAELRRVVAVRGLFGSSFILPLFVIRLACVVAAATSGFLATVLVSLFQFVVAPYSFFASVAAWLAVVPFYIIHFLGFAVLQAGTGVVYGKVPWLAAYLRVPITWKFIGLLFLVDQLICLSLLFRTPIGRPQRVPWRRTLQSVGYGFINCKTYWLILLILLMRYGVRVDLLALGIHALIPYAWIMRGARAIKPILPPNTTHWTFPGAMFYHYHRMVHLPGPYVHAHRPHHYLLDSTPFDADMYGSGMPEEWCKLMTELAVCLSTGLMPWSFTWPTIKESLGNRIGHTRLEGEHPIADNFHTNHHTTHVRNFGFNNLPLDLLMNTAHGDVSRMANWDNGRTRCAKLVEGEHYVLEIRTDPNQ